MYSEIDKPNSRVKHEGSRPIDCIRDNNDISCINMNMETHMKKEKAKKLKTKKNTHHRTPILTLLASYSM
jgi:hypothetical protein